MLKVEPNNEKNKKASIISPSGYFNQSDLDLGNIEDNEEIFKNNHNNNHNNNNSNHN